MPETSRMLRGTNRGCGAPTSHFIVVLDAHRVVIQLAGQHRRFTVPSSLRRRAAHLRAAYTGETYPLATPGIARHGAGSGLGLDTCTAPQRRLRALLALGLLNHGPTSTWPRHVSLATSLATPSSYHPTTTIWSSPAAPVSSTVPLGAGRAHDLEADGKPGRGEAGGDGVGGCAQPRSSLRRQWPKAHVCRR